MGTYKPFPGNQRCTNCPEFSESPKDTNIRTYCPCIFGYYRHESDDVNTPCTRPPSKPRKLKVIAIDKRKINLSWTPPEDKGMRKDIFYKISCNKCDEDVVYNPRRDNLKQTKYVT